MSHAFWRSLALVVGIAGVIGFAVPNQVQAGTCFSFCRSLTQTINGNPYITRTSDPGSCGRTADCRPSASCPSGTVPVSDYSIVSGFCDINNRAALSSNQAIESAWCNEYLIDNRYDGRCRLDRAAVSGTPAPPPAHPGDEFRCLFLCRGDTTPREGGTCRALNDADTCKRECISTCGSVDNCAGLTLEGRVDADASDQAPQCVAVRPPTESVGGLVERNQYERLNEVFPSLSIPNFIGNVIKVMLGLAGALFFGMLIWGGLRWLTAGGDPGSVKAAMTITKNAILGVVIIVLSYTILSAFMQIVAQFAGSGS